MDFVPTRKSAEEEREAGAPRAVPAPMSIEIVYLLALSEPREGFHDLRCHLAPRMPGARHEHGKTANGGRRGMHHRDCTTVVGACLRPKPAWRPGAAEP